jgi:Predicted membrane protein (DUF2142)
VSGASRPAAGPLGRRLGSPRRARGSVVTAVLASALMFVALAAWAFASPVGASPDDDFHLASIWCAGDGHGGACETTDDPDERLVASGFSTSICYVFHADQSADCQDDVFDPLAEDESLETERGNFAGLYPPVFYGVTATFAGPDLGSGVLAIRVFNAFLFVAFVTAVVAAVPPALRRPVVVGVVATAVPLGMFIVPSTNPSSWALLCAATLWPSVLGMLRSSGRRAVVLGILALVSILIGAGARADAAVFGVFAVGVAVVLGVERGRSRGAWAWRAVVLLLVVVGAYLLFGTASQGAQVGTGLPNAAQPDRTVRGLLVHNLFEVPRLWTGMLGGWGLGWLDTQMSGVTTVLAPAVFFALVFWGLSVLSVRKVLAVLGVFLALYVVPLVLLVQTRAVVGEHVQPRYILPLAVVLAGVATLPVRGVAPRLTGVQAAALVAALGAANSLALHTNIRRYVTGVDSTALDLDFAVEWWWPAGPGPMTTWALGSLAFVAGLTALAVLDARTRGRDVEASPRPAEQEDRPGVEAERTEAASGAHGS